MIYHKKREITQAVIAELSEPVYLDSALGKWWSSGRVGESLRLTAEGTTAFHTANIAYHEYHLFTQSNKPKDNTGVQKFLFEVGKKIRCPYYIDYNKNANTRGVDPLTVKIRIYDERISMMITLYGTFQEYLDSVTLS